MLRNNRVKEAVGAGSTGKGPRWKPSIAASFGFTLLELMIVISILLILITIAIPMYQRNIKQAHEAVLRQDLFDLNKLVSEYTLDKQKPPQSLDDLVQAQYLKEIPKNPITNAVDWEAVPCEEDTIMSPDEKDQEGGICSVRSPSLPENDQKQQ